MKFTNKNTFEADKFKIQGAECLVRRKESMPPIILDLRSPAEFEQEHLPGAHSLPAEFLENNLMQIPPFASIVLYGAGDDAKTIEAVKFLFDNGFSDLSWVQGGYAALQKALDESDEVVLSKLPKEKWAGMIEDVLDHKIRPALASDGGGLTVNKIEEDQLYIHYEGACHGCASSSTGTLRFIQNTLRIALNHDINVVSV